MIRESSIVKSFVSSSVYMSAPGIIHLAYLLNKKRAYSWSTYLEVPRVEYLAILRFQENISYSP